MIHATSTDSADVHTDKSFPTVHANVGGTSDHAEAIARSTEEFNVAAEEEEDWEKEDVTLPQSKGNVNATGDASDVSTASSVHDDVIEETGQAFGKIRIMPPPPSSQDGGAYERTDPYQNRAQSLFDPNASGYSMPVSPATATAASALHGPLDPVLVAGLENPRERLSLLKFEDQIVRFIKNPREQQLSFPPLSSYHRLIIHRLAQRCYLDHQTADYNPYAQGYESNSARVVTLFKTSHSCVPSVLLIDLSSDRQQSVTPATAPKIMMRKRTAPRPGADGGRSTNADNRNARSMQDRERAYAEARARIFGEDNNSTVDSASSSPSSTTSSAAANSSNEGGGFVRFGAQQALGPDGSDGFGRGRGKMMEKIGKDTRISQERPQYDRSPIGSNEYSRALPTNTASTSDQPSTMRQQNWKESKVLWRNREQELNDPDFTRNHEAYRPLRAANDSAYASGNRYGPPQGMGRYGATQSDYYDGPGLNRSYGYQGHQPPLPGRRYGSGEYNRVDNSYQRSPPPPDHYRGGGGHHINPPPPGAPVTWSYAYSPHNRSTYHTSTRNYQPEQRIGAYNDDFPPLSK